MKKTGIALLLAAALLLGTLAGCGSSSAAAEDNTIRIAYQYGMAYAPMVVIQDQDLLTKHYGSEVEADWQVMNSGAAINEAMTAGELDVACMGIAPFVTGVSKGIEYKLFSAMSEQPMGLNTYREDITSLADFTAEDKIALVGYGSIQHIMLGMACEEVLGDAHALDQNLMNMAHPDGMQALVSESVAAHLTTAPYYNMELDEGKYHEIEEVADAFPDGCTIIVGAASNRLHDENPKMYEALAAAVREAIEYINDNPTETAELLREAEGVSLEVMEGYLADERCNYAVAPQGVLEVAAFMERAEFAENVPTSYEEIYFADLIEEAGV